MNSNNPFLPTEQDEDALYEGRSFPSINVSTGEKLNKVVEQIAIGLSALTRDDTLDISSLTGISLPCASKIHVNRFTYQVNIQDNTISFSYNMSETVEGIGQDLAVIKSGVEIVTGDMTIEQLKGPVGGATFKASSFPLNAVFHIDVGGECGIVRLKREVKIPLLKDKAEQRFEIQDFGDSAVNTPKNVQEAITIISEAIRSLSDKIDTRTLLEGGKPISESVIDVKKEYAYIRDELNAPDPLEKETQRLEDRLDQLQQDLNALEQENRRLSRDIERITRNNPT